MKLSVPFTVLNQLKIDHWQTRSFAEHKALQKAYESFDELFDKFVETFYGKTYIPEDTITYNIQSNSYTSNIIARYISMKNSVLTYLREFVDSEDMDDLRNIVDEIEAEFNVLIYRLNQK